MAAIQRTPYGRRLAKERLAWTTHGRASPGEDAAEVGGLGVHGQAADEQGGGRVFLPGPAVIPLSILPPVAPGPPAVGAGSALCVPAPVTVRARELDRAAIAPPPVIYTGPPPLPSAAPAPPHGAAPHGGGGGVVVGGSRVTEIGRAASGPTGGGGIVRPAAPAPALVVGSGRAEVPVAPWRGPPVAAA